MKLINWTSIQIINFFKSLFHNWVVFLVGSILFALIYIGLQHITSNQILLEQLIQEHHDLSCKEFKI